MNFIHGVGSELGVGDADQDGEGFFRRAVARAFLHTLNTFFDWPLVRHRSSPSVEALRVFLRLLSASAVGLKFVELENMYVKTQQIFGFL